MTPIRFIALRTTPYSDTRSILTAFSREHGRVALSLATGGGKRSSRVRALTMSLSIVSGVATIRPGREIWNVSQLMPSAVSPSLHSDPVKQMIAMFLAEMLTITLGASGPDEAVFDFVELAVGELERADPRATANFHICFLYQLGRLLGIEPDISTYAPGSLLDLREGRFRATAPLTHPDWLEERPSAAAYNLSRMRFGNMHCWRFTKKERAETLDTLLRYYSIHFASLRSLKTLDILRSLMV